MRLVVALRSRTQSARLSHLRSRCPFMTDNRRVSKFIMEPRGEARNDRGCALRNTKCLRHLRRLGVVREGGPCKYNREFILQAV